MGEKKRWLWLCFGLLFGFTLEARGRPSVLFGNLKIERQVFLRDRYWMQVSFSLTIWNLKGETVTLEQRLLTKTGRVLLERSQKLYVPYRGTRWRRLFFRFSESFLEEKIPYQDDYIFWEARVLWKGRVISSTSRRVWNRPRGIKVYRPHLTVKREKTGLSIFWKAWIRGSDLRGVESVIFVYAAGKEYRFAKPIRRFGEVKRSVFCSFPSSLWGKSFLCKVRIFIQNGGRQLVSQWEGRWGEKAERERKRETFPKMRQKNRQREEGKKKEKTEFLPHPFLPALRIRRDLVGNWFSWSVHPGERGKALLFHLELNAKGEGRLEILVLERDSLGWRRREKESFVYPVLFWGVQKGKLLVQLEDKLLAGDVDVFKKWWVWYLKKKRLFVSPKNFFETFPIGGKIR